MTIPIPYLHGDLDMENKNEAWGIEQYLIHEIP